MILPGPKVKNTGALEDLCLEIVKKDPLMKCVDPYLQCILKRGEKLPRKHKNKLYTFLAGQDEYVGMKLGEAAKAAVWDFEHTAFEPFKNIILQM